MENFINDFKIYCENVEDTKGLEIVRENIILSFYNLETLVYDYCELKSNLSNQITEGEKLINTLSELINKSKEINSLNIRETWKAFEIAGISHKFEIEDTIDISVSEAFEFILKKYGIEEELTDEIVEKEKWYKDLFELEEKHF